MYIEVREKSGKYYVILRHEDSTSKPLAQFATTYRHEAQNVARQYAKQNKCLVRWTSGGIETPDLPIQPDDSPVEG